jgi:hypothetical protein
MRICPRCNGSGVRFVEREICTSCEGTGREREYALGLPPGIVELDQLPRAERIKLASETAMKMIALEQVAKAAREVEKWLHAHAREANCDVVNDDHEQLRSALHNLDSTSEGHQ